MACKTRRAFSTLFLIILLPSCAGIPQPAKGTPVPTALAQTIFHLDRSALSYGTFETEAMSLVIDISSTMPGLADISVEDGSGVTTYEVQPGESKIVHSMSPAVKRVTVTSGGQSKVDNEIKGIFINKITFDGPAVQIHLPGKQIVIYGDSIVSGGNVRHPSAEAWPILLRKRYSVTVNAYGYRSLYDDAATPEARSAFASEVSSQRPDYIWLAIGTNDYRFEQWSAQDFGEAYAATLDDVHSSTPQATLFAQSPIHRTTETPNLFGDSLEKYRQQIAAACLARPAWCVFVDGTDSTFPQLNELDKDGVHLTKTSSIKYAEAVLNIIDK